MDYRIRELKPEDNRRIEYIIRTCLVEFGADHAGTAWADPDLGRFSEVYNEEGSQYWVAENVRGEVIGGVVKIIDNQVEENRETDIEELLAIVKGPDFPTGGTILGTAGINEAYRTGRGKVRVRAVTDIEPMQNGKNRIVVTELPYMVNKARLIEKIAELVKDKKIDGITDLRDESDRQGMRICIELRRDVNPNVTLNLLYKHTQLQDTFGVIMLC